MDYSESFLSTFWSKVDKNASNDCWLWTGSKYSDGYGRTKRFKKYRLCHKISYELHKGPVPIGIFVCHSCDIRSCVNPNHLWLGTHNDNMKDMVKKKRSKNGIMRGEKNPMAILFEVDVKAIKLAISDGETNVSIGKRFGVHHSTISAIKRKKNWLFINEETDIVV